MRSEDRASQELIGQPNLEGRCSIQWETLSQGKEAESNRERHKAPCSDLHMHAYVQAPAHTHVCTIDLTHTHTHQQRQEDFELGATQQDPASQQNNNTEEKAFCFGYWLYIHRHN